MFRVGQKVECVDVSNRPGCGWIYNDPPIKGRVYTIEAISFDNYPGEATLILVEQKRDPRSQYMGYAASRFRPIVERKTDISCLKALLVPGAKILEGV